MIPYGTKYTVKVSGSTWKSITCENCGCEYAYQVKHETSGSATNVLWLNKDGAIRNAQDSAKQNLETYLKNTVLNYHCPSCGFYQANMVQSMKDTIRLRALILGFITFFIVAVLTTSSSFGLLYSIAAGIVVGIVLMSPLRDFNPNTNASSRINQEFSESYPVVKKEKEQSLLNTSAIEKIEPFAVELFERVNTGEDMEIVARSIAKRADVSPDQVLAFGYALAQALKEKQN